MKTRAVILLLLGCVGLVAAATVESRAARIRIRVLEFEDTSPREAFEFLREQAKAADPDGIGLNMLFRLTPQGRKAFNEGSVTLKLTDVPLTAAVRYLCLVSGLRYTYDENALLVSDIGLPQAMETRIYHLNAGIVDSPRTRSRAKSLDDSDDDDDDSSR